MARKRYRKRLRSGRGYIRQVGYYGRFNYRPNELKYFDINAHLVSDAPSGKNASAYQSLDWGFTGSGATKVGNGNINPIVWNDTGSSTSMVPIRMGTSQNERIGTRVRLHSLTLYGQAQLDYVEQADATDRDWETLM